MLFYLLALLASGIYLVYFFLNEKEEEEKISQTGKIKIPGPTKLPLIGSLLSLIPFIGKTDIFLKEMFKKYGRIFGFQFGITYIIFTNDNKLIKKILTSEDLNEHCILDHPMFFERSFDQPSGLITNVGEDAKYLRKFTLRYLREFGFGVKEKLEELVNEELDEFLDRFDKEAKSVENGVGVVLVKKLFQIPFLNILWKILTNSRFEYNDEKLFQIFEIIEKMRNTMKLGLSTRFAYPFLRHIPYLTDQENVLDVHHDVQNLFKNVLEEKRKFLQENKDVIVEPTDVMGAFLDRMNRNGDSPEIDRLFTEEQAIMVGSDMFIAGSDSTSANLEFAVLFILMNPEIQEKIHLEIDSVIGRRPPVLSDKNLMPYMEATTHEVFRIGSSLPVTIRAANSDTSVDEYFIPKNALLITSFEEMNYSTQFWPDPEIFRPERFLDADGRVIHADKVFPFGFGKRSCIAENIARLSFFKFFITIFQKYKFELSPNHPKPSTELLTGFAKCVQPFYVKVIERD